MSLLKILVNGQTIIVDAPSKAAAKAHGKSLVEVKVDTVDAADLVGVDVAKIPKIEAKAKKTTEAASAEGEGQAPAAE